ncbi:ArsR/SmtB family transcription factor [Undibacterium terreum]|uniref:Transcriptional regulator n=1 Tax=Undibacterium terreum TaxID=1224302 RepID=A0A916UDC8_9BURK|nr:helix-turn-helix transcriptional regulator [Undibacterium terreum]GGC69517.1 transcriptional regulator [Undibacterium terreum]
MDIDEIIKALSNPVRREILVWLKDPVTNFPEQEHALELGVCAGKINQRSGLSQSTISSHLAVLQRVGLISSHRMGQWAFFKRNEEAIQAFLDEMNKQL